MYTMIAVSVVLSNLPSTIYAAATTNWDLSTAGNYAYDSNKVEFSSGVAQLKASGTPTTNWIATDGGYNWGIRKPITIDNTQTASTLTDYQAVMTLDTQTLISAGKMSSDCKDIRFTDSDMTTSLSFWLESGCNTTTTRIWIKVPSIAASSTATIYLYYNNSNATSASNGVNTFILFDDFNDNSFDTNKWTKVDPNNKMSEAGGKLNFTYGSGSGNWDAGIYSVQNFARDNISFEFNFKRNSTYSPYNAFMWGWKDTSTSVNYPTLAYGEYSQADAGCSVNCANPNYEKGSGVGSITWQQALDYVVRVKVKSTNGAYYDQSTDGGVTWSTAYSSTQYNDTPMKVAWMHYSGDEVVDNAKIRKWTSVEPTLSAGSESTLYPNDNPTLVPNTAQGYSTLTGFVETLGASSAGTIKYQISPNGGSTWYWWSGAAWATTSAGYTEANIPADINSHIATFTNGSNPKTFKWRAYLNSNGSQLPKLDNVALTFIWDTGNPNNVSVLATAKSQSSGGVDLSVSNGSRWYNYPTPYYTWTDPGDTANEGETESGIGSYYICFNTDPTCHPITGGTPQAGLTYTAGSLVSGSTYYFRMRTKDNAGNSSDAENLLFTYKYDGDKPDNPHYVSASPAGYSNSKAFTFSWPTSNSSAAEDTGGSGLLGYQYRINSDATWYGASHTGAADDVIPFSTGTIAITEADQALVTEGTNIFYLRTIDNAGNISTATVQAPFYYSTNSPPALTIIHVNPISNTSNNFSFNWDDPANNTVLNWEGGIAKYYYSFNTPPNSSSNYTTLKRLDNQAAATVQGENLIFIVSQDNAGNITWGNYKTASFYANTPAPGYPTNLQASDQSIRGTAYKVSLSWSEPTEVGIGVHHYNIYRQKETDDPILLPTTTGRSYLDELQNSYAGKTLYYRVRAVDSAGQVSADSTVVSIIPKGKYNVPAEIVEGPTVDANSKTATVTWKTDSHEEDNTGIVHKTDSMVSYGKTEALGTAIYSETMASTHSITLSNLEPGTQYHYKVSGMDGVENGNNKTESDMYTFTTEAATTITNKEKDIKVSQTKATLKWTSSRIITKELRYGKSTSYGLTYPEAGSNITSSVGTDHSLELVGLDPGTTYYYQIVGTDTYGDVIVSDNYSFITKPYPKILNITFQPIKTAATTTIDVAWETNVPTTSRVRFTPTDGSNSREELNADYKTAHKFTIGGGKLLDNKTYIFKAIVRDTDNNEASSSDQSYTTPEDTRPAIISNLQTEVSVEGAGETAKVSAVVTWDTDEPTDSQVFYGSGTSGDFDNSTAKDSTMVTSHLIVIADLKGAQTYHLKAKSLDKSGNVSESDAQNFVTNQPSQSVISIILSRLQQTFGWMTTITGVFGK